MNEQLLIELNENIKQLLSPNKRKSKTREDEVKECSDRIRAKWMRNNLKLILK